jgi:predicted nucleic acid-binding protein
MTTSKVCLLDTNVLVYAADKNSPFFEGSRKLIESGFAGEIDLCISPQTISEFFAVITDSKRVENPRTQKEAITEIKKYLQSKRILKIYPGPETSNTMVDLLERYPVKKQEIFDLQLVATMLSNRVKRIFTFNREDFLKFADIEVMEP